MGYRELLLSVAALSLFGMTVFNTYQRINDQDDNRLQREFQFYSMSLAQSFIEEAKTKAFDQNVVSSTANSPNDFTAHNQLGPGPSESYEQRNLNDVDDFNGLIHTDNTSRGSFIANISVVYVEPESPEVTVEYRTYYKKFTVTVNNQYLAQPIQLDYIFSYIQN